MHTEPTRWSLAVARARGLPEQVVWREARVRADISQDALAAMVGTSRRCIARWERGDTWPQAHNLAAYVDALARLTVLEHVDALEQIEARPRRVGRPVGT